VDVLAAPTTQCVAPPAESLLAMTAAGQTPWFDVAPRNTVPFRDAELLHLAVAFQEATEFHQGGPPSDRRTSEEAACT